MTTPPLPHPQPHTQPPPSPLRFVHWRSSGTAHLARAGQEQYDGNSEQKAGELELNVPPRPPQDGAAFSGGWQKMDLLIIVPVHADERGAGESITPGKECAAHTNDTVKPGLLARQM